jgi:hypothetical protein
MITVDICAVFQSDLEQVRAQNKALILRAKWRLTCKHHIQICGGKANYYAKAQEARVCIKFTIILHEWWS